MPARVYKQLWELSEELREMRSLEDFMAAFLPGAAAMINAGSAAFCLHAKAPGAVTIPAKGLGWNLCGPSGTLSLACRDFFLQDPLFTHFREFRESGEAYRVIASSGMIAPPRLSDPEFFCEFLWPLRQSEYIGLFVNNVMDSSGYFGFHRPPGAGCFGAREKRVLAIMAPRLREIIPWSDERSEPWSARDEAVPHPNFGMRKMGGGPRRKGLEMNG
ncbi:MAG: hypothetical protein OEZ32_10900 [Nitrospinota bacterium]|nr:hypothetical protein [Nitrospinota bacterium]